MASCNLRNFEGSALRFRKIQVVSRNLTDFVKYKKPLRLIVRKIRVILRNLTVFVNYLSLSIPPENVRKPKVSGVFRGYGNGTLG